MHQLGACKTCLIILIVKHEDALSIHHPAWWFYISASDEIKQQQPCDLITRYFRVDHHYHEIKFDSLTQPVSLNMSDHHICVIWLVVYKQTLARNDTHGGVGSVWPNYIWSMHFRRLISNIWPLGMALYQFLWHSPGIVLRYWWLIATK